MEKWRTKRYMLSEDGAYHKLRWRAHLWVTDEPPYRVVLQQLSTSSADTICKKNRFPLTPVVLDLGSLQRKTC